jgi:hypothetical protein
LCDDSPNEVKYQRGLAQTYDNLAILYRNQGPKRLAQAEETFEKALALHRMALAAQPGIARHQHELATCYGNLGILYLYSEANLRWQNQSHISRRTCVGRTNLTSQGAPRSVSLGNLDDGAANALPRGVDVSRSGIGTRKRFLRTFGDSGSNDRRFRLASPLWKRVGPARQ